MPVTDPNFAWNIDELINEVDCPCCGCETWVEMRGHGFWCDDCNTQISDVRMPNGDDGYIVEFDPSAAWSGDVTRVPDGDDVKMTAKFLGSSSPELYWFAAYADGEDVSFTPVGEKLANA